MIGAGDEALRSLERATETDPMAEVRLAAERSRRGIVLIGLDEVERRLMTQVKAADPRTRATGVIFYSLSTGCRKHRSCKLCGRLVCSWSSKYPKTKQAEEAEAEHFVDCVRRHASGVLQAGEALA